MFILNGGTNESKDSIVGEPLGFLEQKESPYADNRADNQKAAKIEDETRRDTLKTLNALKIVSPIIQSLMLEVNEDGYRDYEIKHFQIAVDLISEAAISACDKLGVDLSKSKNLWIRNVFEKTFSEIYLATKSSGVQFNKELLLRLVENIDYDIEDKIEFVGADPMESATAFKLAIFKAVNKIFIFVKTNFGLYRTVENDMETFAETILSSCAMGVEKLSSPYTSSDDKVRLFGVLSGEAAALYNVAWQAEAKRVKGIADGLSDEQLKKFLSKHPNGLPLDNIEKVYEEYFNKMILVAQKLTPTKAGSIKTRMK